jgi:hypothetical protein
VTFDGVDDTMTLGTNITTARTVFWVVREVPSASVSAYRSLLGHSFQENFLRGANGEIWNASTGSPNVYNGVTRLNGTVVPAPTTTLFPQGAFQIVSLVATGNCTAGQITKNQTNVAQVWYGDFAELIIYNAALSDTDRANIEAYLANKYAQPLTTPANANLVDVRDPGNNPVFMVTAGGGQVTKTYTFTLGTTYAASANDYIILINKTTGSATSVTLPTPSFAGQVLIVKDAKGDAATNHITITPASGTIDGATSLVLSANYAVARLLYNGSGWNTL